MVNCRVDSLVYYEHAPKEYVLKHHHNYYEMVFYKNGTGEVNIEGEKHDYYPNTVSIVKPGDEHDELSSTFTIVYIVLFEVVKYFQLDNILITLDEETANHVNNLFLLAFKEYQEQGLFYNEYVNSLFNQILIEILRKTTNYSIEKRHNFYIEQTKKYIRENYVNDIDFKMLAKTYGYSYDHFRHLFKEHTGITLNQYLLNTRLDIAKNLLRDTEYAIKEIAYRCGFSSDSRFVHFFNARMGISPLKFRTMIREDNALGVVRINKE